MPRNPEKRKAYMEAYRAANQEKIAAQKKEWYLANKDIILKREKLYCKTNRDKINEYARNRYNSNPEYRARRIACKKECMKRNPRAKIKSDYRYNHGLDLPDSLVELIAINRKIKRELREKHC